LLGAARRQWDGAQLLFLLYVSVFVPFRVCFDVPPEPWHWDFVLDIFVPSPRVRIATIRPLTMRL
jgi:hypothetical protein